MHDCERCDWGMNILAMILYLLAPCPRCPANKVAEELAVEFERCAKVYDLRPSLLVVMGFQESTFERDAVGGLGEVGIFQVHGKSRAACVAAKIDPKGVECGAFLIDMNRRYCGDLRRGLHRYMSGTCKGTPRSRRKTDWRLRKAERLRKKFS